MKRSAVKQMSMGSVRPVSVILTILLFLVVVCGVYSAGKEEVDWPQWRGPNGDGVSEETDWDPEALKGGAKILWKADAGIGFSNLAIQGDYLCTMGIVNGEDHVLCFKANTGEEIWRYSFETFSSYGPMATPAIDGSRVYALGPDGTLLCLKSMNGELLWRKRLGHDFDARRPAYGFSGSPVVDGKLLLVNANSKMIGLEKNIGDFVWSIENIGDSYSTVVVSEIGGERCALFVGPRAIHGVEVSTGSKLWTYVHGGRGRITADSIVLENEVFLSFSQSCFMLRMTETEVTEVWDSTELNTPMSGPVLVDGHLYGTHKRLGYLIPSYDWNRMLLNDWPFRCVSWETGDVMWEHKMKSVSLIAAGGMLIVLELDGTLHIVEATPSSFQERSSADVLAGKKAKRIFATPPVLLDGRIYCRNHAGDLICIDVSK